jgi:predicted PolB exonuclease-like 3'-5' exonuclease
MKTITLDIETIADPAACEAAGICPADGFPAWPLHQLLCVSLLTHERIDREDELFTLETFSRADLSERAIVAEVEQRLREAQMLITYHGRGFDLPVLLARAAVTGERVPALLRAGRRGNAGFHQDLLDTVTDHGAAVRPRLVDLCAGFGIPAKLELGGSSVAALAGAGEYARIARYCEQDVVSTWSAACQWNANSDPGQAAERRKALSTWIRGQQPRLAHLLAYAALPATPAGGRALDREASASLVL